MSRPTIGLAITLPDDPLLARLLIAIARSCVVRQADATEPVDAWMVTDNSDPASITADVPLLVWTRLPRTTAVRSWPRAAVVLGPRVPTGAVGAHHSVSVPEAAVDTSMIPYVAPIIRQRWRTRYGLPRDMVVELESGAGPGLPEHLRATALAVTAVAVATGDPVLSALAWGAPTVTDVGTARRLRLGTSVKTVEADHLAEAAHELTQSEPQMSELAWAGRRLVERTFDLDSAADRTILAAGFPSEGSQFDGVSSRLHELSASPQASASMIRELSS
jgi:hypothetical protein